jgi:hypothetical protein
MDPVGAAPGYLSQPNRALVYDEGRMVPTSIVGEPDSTPSPTPRFSDVVAILNPLQNLPIVGTIYRKLTGDEPHPAARVLGGLLWGGPFGLVGAALTYVAEQVSGKNATEIVKSIFDGSEKPPVAVADGTAPAVEPEAAAADTPLATAALAAPAPSVVAPGQPAPTPVAQSPAQPPQQQGAIAQTRTRNAATRDLAFYQAHAGSRIPAASSAPAPSGPQNAPQIPTFQRPVTPVLGVEPTNGSAIPTRASAPTKPASEPAAPAAMMPETTSADFAQRMLQGLERYQALNRVAQTRAPTVDRAE